MAYKKWDECATTGRAIERDMNEFVLSDRGTTGTASKTHNATSFIEDVLLPHLNAEYDRLVKDYGYYKYLEYLERLEQLMAIKQFIQSRRSEWAQEEK